MGRSRWKTWWGGVAGEQGTGGKGRGEGGREEAEQEESSMGKLACGGGSGESHFYRQLSSANLFYKRGNRGPERVEPIPVPDKGTPRLEHLGRKLGP